MAEESIERPRRVTKPTPVVYQRWLYVVAVVVAVCVITGLLVAADWKWLPGAIGAVTVFAGVVLTSRKGAAESRLREIAGENERDANDLAKAERERSAILFGYNLMEVLNSVDGIARSVPAQRDREAPAVRQSVAVQTKEGVSAQSSRAAYFRVDDLSCELRTMRSDKVASSPDRRDRFTAVFVEREPVNAEVWEILDGSREPLLVEDVSEWDRERGVNRDRDYGTFITVRVEAGGIPFGLLTVNARMPRSLVRDDLIYVDALARILGIVELLCMTTSAYGRAVEAVERRADRMSSVGRTLPKDEGDASE